MPSAPSASATAAAKGAQVTAATGPSADRRRQLGRRARFGLDSLIEVGSGLVILWQFRHPLPETRERQALRLIAVSFFALAAYVTVESARCVVECSQRCRRPRIPPKS